MSRVALSQILSLSFYKDKPTLSRRGQPIPQLKCIGNPCRLYQPEAVRCTNLGGAGSDFDWRCEADLPDTLRFGRVEVSCEGWDRPGDPYVLKGALSYSGVLELYPDSKGRVMRSRISSCGNPERVARRGRPELSVPALSMVLRYAAQLFRPPSL